MRYSLVIIILFTILQVDAQELIGLGCKWNDDLSEWVIYANNEEDDGELTLRYMSENQFTNWNFEIGDDAGTIEPAFKKDFTKWEVSGYEERIIIKQKWNNDPREWRVTNNSISLDIKTRYSNSGDEWVVKSQDYGDFFIYTEWEGDPRDWTIVDNLSEEISVTMKTGLLFIALYSSLPK